MSFKLYYFDARGLAEPIRIILAYAGVKYEDIRAPLESIPGAIPKEIKDKCTWGQVPMLEVDGKRLCQSLAITRYVAKKFDLVGVDDFEAAQCDEYVDTVRELMMAWGPLYKETSEEKIEQLKAEIKKSVREKFLNKFEKIMRENGTGKLVGKKLTWADIYIVHALDNIHKVFGVYLIEEYPALKQLYDELLEIPSILKWMETRPNTKL